MQLALYVQITTGRRMVHPSGTDLCEAFHHVDSMCICESWTADGFVEYPEGWFMHPTGEVVTDGETYKEVFSLYEYEENV